MKKIALKSLVGIALVAGMLATSGFKRPGAHAVQVYLDDELVLERYVDSRMEIPGVQVDPAAKQRKLHIRYSECGRSVSGRKISIRNADSKELKTWSFEGTTAGFKDAMTFELRDIIALTGHEKSELQVWYSSNDFPEGVHVLNLVVGGNSRASIK